MTTAKIRITSIDEYIQGFPERIQAMLSELRSTIRLAAPHAMEKISYRMPCFHLNGNLVYFAAYEHHLGFYPTPSGIIAFQEALKGYKTSKGAIRFPIDDPLPLALVRQIVEFRVEENSKNKALRDAARTRTHA